MILRAALSNPTDPKQFLHGVLKRVEDLQNDPELEAFRETPGVYRYAAIGNPTDPKKFLLGQLKAVEEYQNDHELTP